MAAEFNIHLLAFAGSCAIMIISGMYVIKSLVKIAFFLRLEEFITSFIIMAFATSLPELFVGITSAMQKSPSLALGTVIGSNIADLTLIAGIAALLARNIKIESRECRKSSFYMVGFAALPLVLMLLGRGISRIDGAILCAAFLLYVMRLIKQKKRYTKEMVEPIKKLDAIASVLLFIIGIAALYLSANYVVLTAKLISVDLALPPIFIGLFILALGTSLPELVFESESISKGHLDLAYGDLVGSVVVNSTLVLGVAALIYPIHADFLLFLTSSIFMIIAAFLFSIFIETGQNLRWKEGIVLIMIYILFLLVELNIRGMLPAFTGNI